MLARVLRLVVFIVGLFFALGALPHSAQGQTLPEYTIDVSLDYTEGTLSARQQVRYPNRTGRSLSSIVFNVTPAHFGAFQLGSIRMGGQPADYTFSGAVLEVRLPSPLRPGEIAELELDFSERLPRPGNLRFGYSQGILAVGNWYPVVAVFAGDGWDRHPYTGFGDAFFTETANYRVTVTVDQPVSLAHSGRVLRQEGNRWELEALGVRDFALAFSDRYQTRSTQVGATTVTAFFLPEHAAGGGQFLQSAAESLAWFSRMLTSYPYPTLHVAETISHDPDWVGQEYPGLIFLSSDVTAQGGGMGSYVSYLAIHEVAHQWFYALVGNDQIYEPWLDEALATQLTYEFLRTNYPQVYQQRWGNMVAAYRSEQQRWGNLPVDSSIYDYPSEAMYFSAVYRRGALFLEEVRQQVGDEAYFAFLRRYIERFRGGIATGEGFFALAESSLGIDLQALRAAYFRQPATPTPSPSPTLVPTPRPSPTPTLTPSPTPSPTYTPTPTTAPTRTPSPTPSPTHTATPTVSTTPTEVAAPAEAGDIRDSGGAPWAWAAAFGFAFLLVFAVVRRWRRR